MLLLFVMFVVGAVLLGAGAMLAPAWRTAQPRIALSATMALALITGGAVWWAYAFGWDTLVVDYLLFALVSIVVLGGTFSQAQTRAEARGETLEDKDQGWPGPGDLLFFAGVGGIILVLVYTMVLPLGEIGVQLGYLTSLATQSDQFNTLAPHAPQQSVSYAPGFIALTSYLSKQLVQSIAAVQFGVGGVVAFLIVWLSYDWGGELGGKLLGRAFAVASLVTGGALLMLMSGQYTVLLATAFALAATICALRLRRTPARQDAIAGGLLMGAAIYADFAVGLVMLVALGGYIGWHLVRGARWITLLMLVGTLLFGLGPWLLSLAGRPSPLVLSDGLTLAGWLIIPLTYAGGLILNALAHRIQLAQLRVLQPQRYSLLMGALLIIVVGTSLLGLRLRESLPITENDLNVLLWMRENLPPETVLQNTAPNDWASVICECRPLLPPIPVDTNAVPADVAFISEKHASTADGNRLIEQGGASIVDLP